MSTVSQTKVYTELIVTTILSLLAASLWIEWTKHFIVRQFQNNQVILFAAALTITLLSILTLQTLFANIEQPNENK